MTAYVVVEAVVKANSESNWKGQILTLYGLLFMRDSIYAIARICHGNSICLSVTRVDQSKTVEARMTQFSPYSSPIPLVFRG